MDAKQRLPREWAAWVLLGNPEATIPETLESLADRIETAVATAVGYAVIAGAKMRAATR